MYLLVLSSILQSEQCSQGAREQWFHFKSNILEKGSEIAEPVRQPHVQVMTSLKGGGLHGVQCRLSTKEEKPLTFQSWPSAVHETAITTLQSLYLQ